MGIPPGVLFPSLALGSAGGGDSAVREMICAPRTMVKPSVLFSSFSTTCPLTVDPGAAGLFCLRLTRRNSSVSARTMFICCGQSLADIHGYVTWEERAYFIECQHLTGHLTSIVHDETHAPVDLYLLLATGRILAKSLLDRVDVRNRPIEAKMLAVAFASEELWKITYHLALFVRHFCDVVETLTK